MAKISNWVGPSTDGSGTTTYPETFDRFVTLQAGGAITKGDWVSWNTGGTGTQKIVQVIQAAAISTVGNPAVVGVATATVASGADVVVQVQGYCDYAAVDATAGDPIVGPTSNAGRAVAAAAATTAPVCGLCLVTDTSNVGTVYISNPQNL